MSEWSKVLDSKSSVQQCTVGSNPTLSASKFKASEHFVLEAFFFCFLFLTAFLTSWNLSAVFLFTLDYFLGDTLLHLLRIMHISILGEMKW